MNNRRLALSALLLAAAGLTACSSDKKIGSDSTTSVADTSTTVTTIAPDTSSTQPPVTTPPTAPPVSVPTFHLYDQVGHPDVPSGHTDPVNDSGVLEDGVYWIDYNGGEKFTPDITLVQAFFGDECMSKAAEMSDECLNDIFILGEPSRDISDLPFADDVYLTVADATSQLSYWITPDELMQIRASSPSDGAPADFSFTPFSFLMTVVDGEITRFEQVWTP